MQLIFVYNADSGKANAVLDSLHKIVSPGTYDCKLCELTFGVFAEKSEWKKFRKESQYDMVFLHRDEFERQYRSKWLPKYDFPIVLDASEGNLEILISKEELEEFSRTEELIELLKSRLVQD